MIARIIRASIANRALVLEELARMLAERVGVGDGAAARDRDRDGLVR